MKVFVSYSGAKGETGRQLRLALEANGIDSTDASALPSAAREWSSGVKRELRDSDAAVFVLEPGAERDPYLQQEWRLALEQWWSGAEKPMIPVVKGDTPLPAFLREWQAIRIPPDGDVTAAADAVVATLRHAGARPDTAPAPPSQESEAKQERLDQIRAAATTLQPSNDELAQQAQLLAERCRELERTQPDSLELARARIACSDVLKTMGRKEPALQQLELAIKILEHHPDAARRLARTRMNAGTLMQELGRDRDARVEWEKARDAYLTIDGPLSVNAMIVRTSLIALLKRIDDNAAADAEQATLNAGVQAVATTAFDVLRSTVRRGFEWLTGKLEGAGQKSKGGES
jgi:hypothetical protein